MFSSIVRSSTQTIRSIRPQQSLLRLSLRTVSTNNKINVESIVQKYSAKGPIAVKYTSEHEWIAQHEDGVAFIGITKYASDALGDATFVELPELGETYSEGDSIGSVESVKSSSEIFAPVDGTVVSINEALNDKPQLINEDPLGEGWLAQIELTEELSKFENLLSEEEYQASLHDE